MINGKTLLTFFVPNFPLARSPSTKLVMAFFVGVFPLWAFASYSVLVLGPRGGDQLIQKRLKDLEVQTGVTVRSNLPEPIRFTYQEQSEALQKAQELRNAVLDFNYLTSPVCYDRSYERLEHEQCVELVGSVGVVQTSPGAIVIQDNNVGSYVCKFLAAGETAYQLDHVKDCFPK